MSDDKNKILVVDDETVIRELMTDILVDEGYQVESAASGEAALDLLGESDGFVLLFTDIMMPQMNGIELIRKARRIIPSLIPIVMTGYATLETAQAAVREGAYDYVLKPFSLGEVKVAVANALERHRLTNENARLLELTELFKISESIATIHDEQKLMDFILKAALERVDAERGSLMLTTPDGKALEVAASVGVPEDITQQMVDAGSSISGWVAKHRVPLRVEDIGQNPDLAEISRNLDDASFVSVPLERKLNLDNIRGGKSKQSGQRVLAVLNVNRKRGGGCFTEGDLKTLNIVASHGAVALENVRLLQDVEDAHLATIQSMALALEAKDAYTHGHSERVRNFSVMAALRLGMNARDIGILRLGALLHDVGKIGVQDSILNKIENLATEDWQQITRHPIIGFEVLEPVGFLTAEHLSLVRSHHERLDGTGYPDGLGPEDQDERVRIIAVADTYDAMFSNRAYRKGLSPEKIIVELKRCAGVTLDPRIIKLFTEMIESGEISRYADTEPDFDS